MQRYRSTIAKIAFGLFLILWDSALLFFGPFYSRGYPLPRPIGILFIAIGVYYLLLIYHYRDRKRESKAADDELSKK